jgi:phosphonatase-like hydrolase
MIRNVKLVVLDMAGTTVAVSDAVPEALRDAFEHEGIELASDDIAALRGRSKREAIAALVERLRSERIDANEMTERILARFRSALRDRYAAGVSPIVGALETMKWLRSVGIKVCLTTGFDRELTDLIVRSLRWGPELVDAVICADDVARGRPAPDMILLAMKLTGVDDPSVVAVVGDTSADLLSGSNAGAGLVVGVLTGAHGRKELARHPHSTLLESIADLPSWLEMPVAP